MERWCLPLTFIAVIALVGCVPNAAEDNGVASDELSFETLADGEDEFREKAELSLIPVPVNGTNTGAPELVCALESDRLECNAICPSEALERAGTLLVGKEETAVDLYEIEDSRGRFWIDTDEAVVSGTLLKASCRVADGAQKTKVTLIISNEDRAIGSEAVETDVLLATELGR